MLSVLTALLLAQNAPAQLPDWVLNARIDSVYYTSRGNGSRPIRALVDIADGKGTYTLYQAGGFQANLDNMVYVPMMRHRQGPPANALMGRFIFGGQTGYFVFREPNANGVVDGYWGYYSGNQLGRIEGSWDGILQLIAPVNAPAPQPAVAKTPEPDFGRAQQPRFKGLPEAYTGVRGLNADEEWFNKGGKLGHSVGQVVTKDGTAWGCVFLVGDGIGLTVRHVFDKIGSNKLSEVRFQVPGEAKYEHFQLNGEPIFIGDDDIALIRIAVDPKFTWLKPIALPSLMKIRDATLQTIPGHDVRAKNVQVIHFPGNQGRRTNIRGTFIDPETEWGYRYTTETEGGSSGAPVFDFDWNLVALHWGSQERDDGKPPEYNIGYKIEYVIFKVKQHLQQTENGKNILALMWI